MPGNETNFGTIKDAAGLTQQESSWLEQLVNVFNSRLEGNKLRMSYYEDKNTLKNIGLTIPSDIAAKIDARVGWAAKAVDYVAQRSIYDSITGDAGAASEINGILAENDFAVEYSKALPTMLVHGMGAWTVTKGGRGEPAAVINYHGATSSAMLWDFRRKRVKCGFVVEDYELVAVGSSEMYRPSVVVMHTDRYVLEIVRDGEGWRAYRKPHMLGRCLMVPMCFAPTDSKPFGKSRISKPVMSITDEMQREIVRMSIHAEVFSSGQKAILGASDEQYDNLMGKKFRAAMSELLVITRDENGEIPQITQFAQQSMEPHIKFMEMLMSRMASETSIPVAEYGLASSGYQSSDALRASDRGAVIVCESVNRNNGKAICEVARLALAIARNKTLGDLTDAERQIQVHWIDPSMPSAASVADATSKLAGVVPEFGGTEIFWELNGFNEEQRRRVKADMDSNQQRAIAASVFGGR